MSCLLSKCDFIGSPGQLWQLRGEEKPLLTYVTAQKEKRMEKIFQKGCRKRHRDDLSVTSCQHKMYRVTESYCYRTIH